MLPLPTPAPQPGALFLGLRPEHAGMSAPGGAGWPFEVELAEMLGAERLVHGRIGKAPFTLRIDGRLAAPQPGDRLTIDVHAERLHWFDRATGMRVGGA